MQKQFRMTQDRYDELKKELDYLKTVREKEVVEQIKEARSFGDLSENSEYDEAKNEQGKLYSRINELEEILTGAVIVTEDDMSTDTVAYGSKVKVREVGEDEEEEYQIVGSQEVNLAEGKISDESPLGKALIGKKAGDIAEVDAPIGKIEYEVLSIAAK